MRFLPTFTAILFIWTTLHMVRPADEEGCQNAVNAFRKKAGLGELKEDEQETAHLKKKFIPGTKNCPTKDQLENGVDGFTVTT
ncbi:hypothetical protein B9Z55_017209 [Caenorhabditis nigoni]|uniref:Uncharacterized protein n=1 Tax=Caenorhabditis nigoni TaxID=1611254 RepID=A0A2G5T822_9PELO|nr:hypothetical protein B9Z55_017209 [Caenorhabditis nigoni]